MPTLDGLKPAEVQFWQEYLATLPDPRESVDAKVRAGMAGNPSLADSLLNLYLEGKKTAGSGLVRDFEMAGDPLPAVGDHWIILDSNEVPRCIVKVISVEYHLFRDVTEAIARAEGEGDLSLGFWRSAHEEFFTPYLEELRIKDLQQAEIVTEFFKVVFPL